MHTHTLKYLSLIAFCLFSSFLFNACSQSSSRFHLEGEFKNLNQGEFYLYNPDQGTKDTIAVNGGQFSYDRVIHDTITLVLLFPNYSELPVFAQPGAEVTMKGDVSHLRDTQVTGTEDNDAMTAFRTKTNEMMPPEVQKAAQQFINSHLTSPVSNYLLRRYFLQNANPDYALAHKLCEALHQAQPQNPQLARLHTLLESLKNHHADGQLPAFKAVDTKGDTITQKNLNAEANVIAVWASWSFDSQNILRQLATLQKDHPRKISVVTISLDASPAEGKNFLEHDSITWPNICDSLMWQSPVLAQLGIGTLPSNILTDKKGKIVARDVSNVTLKEKIESLLKEKE